MGSEEDVWQYIGVIRDIKCSIREGIFTIEFEGDHEDLSLSSGRESSYFFDQVGKSPLGLTIGYDLSEFGELEDVEVLET